MTPRKKKLIGWTWKNWNLYRTSFGEIHLSQLYTTKSDCEEMEYVKVAITIEELPTQNRP